MPHALMSAGRRVATRAAAPLLALVLFVTLLSGGAGAALQSTVLTNPATVDELTVVGNGQMAEQGLVTAMLYRGRFWHQPWVYFRDASTGAQAHVSLPVPEISSKEWWNASFAWRADDLWVLAGDGPVYLRHYKVVGSPVPTSATLVSTGVFGTTDSRAGDLVVLANGGVVGAWHQQGFSGPQGLFLVHVPAGGSAAVTGPLQFMPTGSSVQALAQHPADGSIWLFNAPDAFGSTGAAHLAEGPGGLTVDWTTPTFFSIADGDNGSDPENPFVVAVPDPSTSSIAVAYESRVRTSFSRDPVVIGSQPVVARVAASGAKSFLRLPVYVERISQLGLSVRAGETWLSYRPVDATDASFDDAFARVYRDGAWQPATPLGTLETAYGYLPTAPSRPEFGARLNDAKLHFIADPAGSGSGSTTTTSTTAPTSSTSTTKNGKGGSGGKPRR